MNQVRTTMDPAPSAQGAEPQQTAAWQALLQHQQAMGGALDLRAQFADDPGRAQALTWEAPHIVADLSKNLLTSRTLELLRDLADAQGVPGRRDAMFAGACLNASEQRPVKHWLLRAPRAQAAADVDLVAVHQVLDAMLDFAEAVRADAAITDIVHLGIGGSDLGPQLAVQALQAFASPARRLHFVSNVDAHALASVLDGLRPAGTLFIVASKTFTTAETLLNARTARDWFLAHGGQGVERHFVALTTNAPAAAQFGIRTTFSFWDWVGGRYSLWSAIGLPVAIAIGADNFRNVLAGAHAMDQHFRTAAPEHNLPLTLGLVDVWYRNFLGFATRCVAPYHAWLARLPAYLQQLEMESNGKAVDGAGRPCTVRTAPVVWGEAGTNGQHAFFQLLHQGTDIIPTEFVVVREAVHGHQAHHVALLANALAQARALMLGRAHEDPHRHIAGNRPSTMLVLDRLSPESFGALIALHEHRVFVSGSIWGINSFDQWGVELGKVLAQDIEPRFTDGRTEGLDASTASLLRRLGAPVATAVTHS